MLNGISVVLDGIETFLNHLRNGFPVLVQTIAGGGSIPCFPRKGIAVLPPIVTGKGAAELHAAFLEKVVHLRKVIAFNRPSGDAAIKGELVPVLEHRVEGDGNGIILRTIL